MKRPLLVAFVAVLAFAGAACGGDDDSTRPSQAELLGRLKEEITTLTDEQADCLAEKLLASDLSDEVLSQVERKADQDEVDDEDEAAFTDEIQTAGEACGGIEPQAPTTAPGG